MDTLNSSMTTDAACGTKAEFPMDDEQQLWPLKTTPFEHYMLVDDRPSHPMAFCIEVLLEGTLQRADLAAALQVALSRHPLLRAVISRRLGRLPVWIPADTWPRLEWIESETLPTLSSPPPPEHHQGSWRTHLGIKCTANTPPGVSISSCGRGWCRSTGIHWRPAGRVRTTDFASGGRCSRACPLEPK